MARQSRLRCAKWCGSGCTEAQYRAARRLAQATLKKLDNPRGWKIRVWENGGWHVSLSKGTMTLYVRKYMMGEVEYSTLMNFDKKHPGTGAPELTLRQSFKCPNKAIEAQLKVARKCIKAMRPFIEMVGAF